MFSADSTFKMRMMKFNFQIVYVPGRDLQGADALSRRLQSPVNIDGKVDEFLERRLRNTMGEFEMHLQVSKDGLQRIKEATRQDLHMQELIRVVNAGGPNRIPLVVLLLFVHFGAIRNYYCY